MSLLAGIAAWGQGLLVSLYAQDVLGYSAIEFGLASSVMTAGTLVGSFAAQRLASRVGLFPIAAASMALMGAGAAAPERRSTPTAATSRTCFPGLLVFGPGLGAGTVAASIAALSGVPERDAGVASGTNTGAFQIGGALGLGDRDQRGRRARRRAAPTQGLQAAGFLAAALATAAGVARGDDARDAAAGRFAGMSDVLDRHRRRRQGPLRGNRRPRRVPPADAAS